MTPGQRQDLALTLEADERARLREFGIVIPTNSWMNNAQYLAQIGHTLGGAWLVALPVIFLGFAPAWWIAWGVLALATGIKEFWYDARYERDPVQTWQDNLMDFTFYQAGALLVTPVLWLAHHLHRIQ